MKREEKK